MSSRKKYKNEIVSEEDSKSEETYILSKKEIEKKKSEERVNNIIRQFKNPKVYITALSAYIINIISIILFSLPLLFISSNNNDLETNSIITSLKEMAINVYGSDLYFHKLFIFFYIALLQEIIFRLCVFKPIWMISEKIGKNNSLIRITIVSLGFFISNLLYLTTVDGFSFKFNEIMKEYIYFPCYFIPGLVYAGAYYYDNSFIACLFAHLFCDVLSPIIFYHLF